MMNPRVPNYRKHKQSGQAVVTLPDGYGMRKDILLGKHGTKASREQYARIIAEWEANGHRLPQAPTGPGMTVNELILAYWPFVENYYRHLDGTPTSEVTNIRLALRRLKVLYGRTLASEFDSLGLEAVRQQMIKEGLCRGRVNKDVSRIKRMFKWGVAKRIVPVSVYQVLLTIEGLRAGRSEAKETEPVRPVSVAFVEATLPCLLRQVAAMVQLQLFTGMRPGEVVIMRGIDLDMTGKVWLYRPGNDQGPFGAHKTAHRGHKRIIPIGPRGQKVLRPWLRLNVEEYLFRPSEARAQQDAERRRLRNSPMTPSQRKRRRKRKPMRWPGDRYTVTSYARAVARGCEKANIPHWYPNQLRHTRATEIRREAGLDAARAVLGHRSPNTTEIYAELDLGQAVELMERIG